MELFGQTNLIIPQMLKAITKELDGSCADWQLHVHGNSMHSFTTLGADNREMGTVYNADSDRRSFENLENFLTELF